MVSTVTPGMNCIKLLLFIFNLVFWVAGIAIIAVASIVIHNFTNYKAAIERDILEGAPIVLIIVGIIITIVAFFGCYGAIKENHCMTQTFAVLLLIIFLLEMGAAISAFVFRNKLDNNSIERSLNESLKAYKPNEGDKIWDVIQVAFHCCGVKDKADWRLNSHFLNDSLPHTCCSGKEDNCSQNSTDIYNDGCFDKIVNDIKDNAGAIGGIGLGIAFVEIVGIVLACCLARGIRSSYETV